MSVKNPETPGERIKALRKPMTLHGKRLTQQRLAKLAGVSLRTVVGWEADENAPSGENLLQLAAALRTSPEYILTGEGPMEVRSGVGSAEGAAGAHAEGVVLGDRQEATVGDRPQKISLQEKVKRLSESAYQMGYRDAIMDVITKVAAMDARRPASSPGEGIEDDEDVDAVRAVDEAEGRTGGTEERRDVGG